MLLGNPRSFRPGVTFRPGLDVVGVDREVMVRVREDQEIVALGAAKSLQQRVQLLTLEQLRHESDSLRSLVHAALAR